MLVIVLYSFLNLFAVLAVGILFWALLLIPGLMIKDRGSKAQKALITIIIILSGSAIISCAEKIFGINIFLR
ncbi:hypothetical protein GF354_05820 [Candidatus Peregrinibacteria bacterium]|nr:hypothetical protein [Candidatus Peregrinibacteria bacterium]